MNAKFGLLRTAIEGWADRACSARSASPAPGMTVYRKWMDAVCDNIANMNTPLPPAARRSRARYVDRPGQGRRRRQRRRPGVQVAGIELGEAAEGRLVTSPTDPLADADGYVPLPGHRPGRADGPADRGPARLPGEPRRRRPGHATPTRPPCSSGSSHGEPSSHQRRLPPVGGSRRSASAAAPPPQAGRPATDAAGGFGNKLAKAPGQPPATRPRPTTLAIRPPPAT